MNFILDTDVLTILQSDSRPGRERLKRRLAAVASIRIVTTVINFQEQMKGWLGLLNRVQADRQLLSAYAELLKTLDEFRRITVLPFDAAALVFFHDLQRQRVRIGTMDLRVASIALSRQMTVVTCNLRDFGQVPGLVAEDWTV